MRSSTLFILLFIFINFIIGDNISSRPYNERNPYLAVVKVNRELHGPLSNRSCMHIEFNIEGSGMDYEAGDHLAVYPVNSSKYVEKIGKICGADLDVGCDLKNINGNSIF